MKECPILFSASMVLAVHREVDPKTQTRRAIKLPPSPNHLGAWKPTTVGGSGITDARGAVVPEMAAVWHTRTGQTLTSPYGVLGDRLYVKETFYAWGRWETRFSAKKKRDEWHFVDLTLECGFAYRYAATEHIEVRRRSAGSVRWWKRPAIFMPRHASRTDLEIVGTRVEQLQDISEEDAQAEGCEMAAETTYDDDRLNAECGCFQTSSYVHGYRLLWEQINGAGSWDLNPWVWVVEFRRIEP